MADNGGKRDEGQQRLSVGRFARVAKLGGMAARLASDAAIAAGNLAGGRRRAEAILHRRAAATLKKVFSDLKGLPMKVGQILSYVDDAIPEEHRAIYRETLKELQTRTRPVAWARMRQVLEEDLGGPLEERFATFDREPLAAASIGQVYAATLRDGAEVGAEVVVKVQYPGIAEAIRNDLSNIDTVLSALSVALPKVDVEQTVHDVKTRLQDECDYRKELTYQRRFAAIWAGHPVVHIPKVYEEHSGERVLVSERVHGLGFHEMLERADQEEKDRIGRMIFEFVFRSLYLNGIFNADPHPGNYLFEPDGRIAFLDYGCVQTFDDATLRNLTRARQLVVDGVTGPELFAELRVLLGLPDIIDEEMWPVAEQFFRETYRSLISPQPYRFGRDHTEGLTDITMAAKLKYLPKILRGGVKEIKTPGLVFLNRINFGLMSILGMLRAEGEWRALLHAIDVEAGLAEAEPAPRAVELR